MGGAGRRDDDLRRGAGDGGRARRRGPGADLRRHGGAEPRPAVHGRRRPLHARGRQKAKPVPAIMGTNGFGGSKDDFDKLGAAFAERGYAFLAYSGLGFGKSGCKITLDDREHDGAAGSELVSFLGGSKAADDGTKIDYIVKDAGPRRRVAHRRPPRRHDRRLLRRADPVRDRGASTRGWTRSSRRSRGTTCRTRCAQQHRLHERRHLRDARRGQDRLAGAVLRLRHRAGPRRGAGRPEPRGTCPNFADGVCPALHQRRRDGYLDEAGIELLRNASVSSYYDDIHIPVFLTQGQSDNLFNLQESVATYQALKRAASPVKLLWRSSGHSGGGLGKPRATQPTSRPPTRAGWTSRGSTTTSRAPAPQPALDFSFITDWIPSRRRRAPPSASRRSYPAGTKTRFYLSGTDALRPMRGRSSRATRRWSQSPRRRAPAAASSTSARRDPEGTARLLHDRAADGRPRPGRDPDGHRRTSTHRRSAPRPTRPSC